MAGILIYKSGFQYYSFIASDENIYQIIKRDLSRRGAQILWEKANVNFKKLEKARKTKDNLVERLNMGEKVNFEKIEMFFK